MEIKKNKNKLPEKRTMNLYTKGEKSKRDSLKRTILIVLIILFLLFGVFGRYALLLYRNIKLNSSKDTLAQYKSQLVNYKEVKEEYDRYAKNYMTANEQALEDRATLINAANRSIGELGSIQSITITGNAATVSFVVKNMHDIPTIVANFESFNNISYVNVGTVARNTGETENGGSVTTITATINYGIGQQVDASQEVQ